MARTGFRSGARRRLTLAAMVLGGLCCGQTAAAETFTWIVRSLYPYRVQLEFYSQDYDRAWPGGDNVYVLQDDKFHQYTLNCDYGEKICYGAWVDGDISTYWGSGYYGQEYCNSCCSTCDGGTRQTTLNP